VVGLRVPEHALVEELMNRHLCSVLLVASLAGCQHNARSSETARDEDARTNSNLYGQTNRTLPVDESDDPMTPPVYRSKDDIASTGDVPDTMRTTDPAVPGDEMGVPKAGATDRGLPSDSAARGPNGTAEAGLTATDQSEKETDIKLTQEIRRALVSNSNLSFSSKNVKIITRDGRVTLRGSVPNQRELHLIEDSAKQVAGPGSVDNQLEIETK
jgi:hyperosmotically inducible protein